MPDAQSFSFPVIYNRPIGSAGKIGNIELQILTNALRLTLSNYAHLFNEHYNRTGSLFRQKSKFKDLADGKGHYNTTVLDYIHQNPVAAGKVDTSTDWPYSSAKKFAGLRNGTLVNVAWSKALLQLHPSV